MDFASYMQLAHELAIKRTLHWRKKNEVTNSSATKIMYDTIVLSSESKHMLEARFAYSKNESFPFRIIANDEDCAQGHGKPKRFFGGIADNVMVSTMAALKMQLIPETLVLNSCSNFHKLVGDIYGVCRENNNGGYKEYLIDNDNKKFRMKCLF